MIDTLIQQGQPFAAYRVPGEKPLLVSAQAAGSIRLVHDLEELDGKQGFVIAPFCISHTHPAVLIESEKMDMPFHLDTEDEDTSPMHFPEESFRTDCTEEYATRFLTFSQALQEGRFDKLVFSRSYCMKRMPEFSPEAVFKAACRRYIHSYVYLCHTPQTGTWLGCTPEIILSGEKNRWNTVALAGTQPLQNGQLPQAWDEKNRKEQAYVTKYIREQLQSLGIPAEENGPYSAYAGALSHLKTDFSFTLDDNNNLGRLLKVLHPTPAVCGLPKEAAYHFILANEGYDRSYYSGFIGRLDPDGKTGLYVNLRCMHIGNDSLTLYAGGGLLPSSDLKDEWLETEKKMQTLKRLLR